MDTNSCHGFCQNKKLAKKAPTYAPLFAALNRCRGMFEFKVQIEKGNLRSVDLASL